MAEQQGSGKECRGCGSDEVNGAVEAKEEEAILIEIGWMGVGRCCCWCRNDDGGGKQKQQL